MGVIHILKDGSRVDDITGHVVKMEDAELLYRFLHSRNRKGSKKFVNTYEQGKHEVRV